MSVIDGRTAIITGAARNIGRATAVTLAGQGFDIVVHAQSNREGAAETARLADAHDCEGLRMKQGSQILAVVISCDCAHLDARSRRLLVSRRRAIARTVGPHLVTQVRVDEPPAHCIF